MKKFTILTSIYNSKKFLSSYFKTISIQKYMPDEIVLIDDTKNPKDLKNIILKYQKKYKFKKIILIKNKKNLGPAKSYNKGLKKIKNKLIFRLDVDDKWKKNHVSYLLGLHEKYKNVLIYSNSVKYDSIKNRLKCDDYFINENQSIHSSWLINKEEYKDFEYKLENPILALEDYATITYYLKKNFKIFLTNKKSVIYNFANPNSHGKNYKKNLLFIKKKKDLAKELFIHNCKINKFSNFKILNIINFITTKFGIIKFFIYLFWTLDLLKFKFFMGR
jgi:glycosyltransferase involved in cell wall biosynthesis